MMRSVGNQHRAGAMRLGALDLLDHDIQRLVPADAHEFRLAPILNIPLAVRVEVHPLHGMQDAVLRIDHRFLAKPVGGQGGAPRRGEFLAAGPDGPGRRIGFVEVHRRDAHDLAFLHIHKDRPAVGAVGVAHHAIAHGRADLPANGLHAVERDHEPHRRFVRTFHRKLEVLGGVDANQLVEGRGEEFLGDGPVLEDHRKIRILVNARPGADPAVFDPHPAALGVVLQLELGGKVSFLQAFPELGILQPGKPHCLHHAPENQRKSHALTLPHSRPGPTA